MDVTEILNRVCKDSAQSALIGAIVSSWIARFRASNDEEKSSMVDAVLVYVRGLTVSFRSIEGKDEFFADLIVTIARRVPKPDLRALLEHVSPAFVHAPAWVRKTAERVASYAYTE